MSSKMSMMFSQNGGTAGKIMRKVAPAPAPATAPATAPVPSQQQAKARAVVGLTTTARSAPRGIKQLFNLGHIMANPGTPCKACGS
jgi:hypothetical protein